MEVLGWLFTLSSILIGIVIVLENRNPTKTLAWLIVLTFLPGLGFILYIFLGRNYRKRRRFRDKESVDMSETGWAVERQMNLLNGHFISEEARAKRRLIRLLVNNANSPFTLNNRAKILTNGDETFAEILVALSSAKHHIHMEYYILKDDEIGRKIQRILIEKVKQGVEVRVIYDAVGSWRLGKAYVRQLREAGVQIQAFHPVAFPLLNRKVNYRNHRKIVVVDGKIGFLGGLNVGDEYLGKSKRFGFWRDTHLKLEGDAVYMLQTIFLYDWHFVCGEKAYFDPVYFPAHDDYGNLLIQIAASGPDSDWESIMQAYFSAIASAEERIYITSPYFVPDDSITMALKTAALSGIDVRLLLPARPDHYLVYWATMSYLEDLLEAGVRVYLYEKGFIHAKILLVDGILASIGTANMDLRSFHLNFEVNALIYDRQAVARLEKDFFDDLQESRELVYEEYINRPLLRKLKESGARLLSPML
ncbi:cardiolipin synthase [Bacillaceae bacterium]